MTDKICRRCGLEILDSEDLLTEERLVGGAEFEHMLPADCIRRLRANNERLTAFIESHARAMSPHMDGTCEWRMHGFVGRGPTIQDAMRAADMEEER